MNYIKKMREIIGHDYLIVVGSGVILEKDDKILLEQRADNSLWGIPGGLLEIGETVKETAIREIYEETGLNVHTMNLFGIYSGEKAKTIYPNNDKTYCITILFHSKNFEGELKPSHESKALKYFSREELRSIPINTSNIEMIEDWIDGNYHINIK